MVHQTTLKKVEHRDTQDSTFNIYIVISVTHSYPGGESVVQMNSTQCLIQGKPATQIYPQTGAVPYFLMVYLSAILEPPSQQEGTGRPVADILGPHSWCLRAVYVGVSVSLLEQLGVTDPLAHSQYKN